MSTAEIVCCDLCRPNRCENSYRVVTAIDVDAAAVLDGFTITGGEGSGDGDFGRGAGLTARDASLTITNCTFVENAAQSSSAMYSSAGEPTISDCTFVDNGWYGGGGGHALTNSYNEATVTNCQFIRNRGGGLSASGSKPIVGCSFIENTNHTGLILRNGAPNIIDCTFVRNEGGRGGGMWNLGFPQLINCGFYGNSAGIYGGGMYNYFHSSPAVSNCAFTANSAYYGGGMGNLEYSSPTVSHCTFSRNIAIGDGGGVYSYRSSSAMNNCILWGDSPDEFYIDVPGEEDPTVSFSDVQGGLPDGTIDGGGNIDADPPFVRNPNDGGDGWGDDPDTAEIDEGANDDFGDLRPQSGSLCINSGDPDFIPEPGEADLDGHARVLCGRVDMGAYEFGIGDYDCDRFVDVIDFAAWDDCMTGPNNGPYWDGCEAFDFDADNDIDVRDFSGFQTTFPAP